MVLGTVEVETIGTIETIEVVGITSKNEISSQGEETTSTLMTVKGITGRANGGIMTLKETGKIDKPGDQQELVLVLRIDA